MKPINLRIAEELSVSRLGRQRRVKCEPDLGAHPTTVHLGRA
jgi:hypothetical protein